ncbi:sulfatase [Pontibacter sp. G13]|uniref:sulfatase family protein n=1 Tax=Pontibacter sp. G13 TaxID=3074898 RepID=UPI00288BAEE9|nr:sulfatase [Pontibacter sp. G13]WNJ19146.1 sulfatase [Pontibacter sp. G13]
MNHPNTLTFRWAISCVLTGLLLLLTGLVQAQRPNILIYIADDISYPHLSAYGCEWVHTPAFDRIAQEGLLFNRAYTPNAKCAPSRACFLTGRNSWQLEEAMNHFPYFPAKFQTFMEALGDQGYLTGHTGKGWAPGDPGTKDGKRRQLTGPDFNKIRLDPPTSGISHVDYAGNFEVFLETREGETPFCFWYGSNEPHRSYEFQSGVEIGGKKLSQVDRVPGYWPDNDTIRHDILDYAYEIEYADGHFGKMIEILEARGELDNTLIIAVADHGMPFPRVKGQAYEFSNHIPLAIRWPKQIQQPGTVVDEFVSIIDLAPTIMAAAGVRPEATDMEPMTGQGLIRFMQDSKAQSVRDFQLICKERHDTGRPHDWGYPIRGIIRDSLLYIFNFEPTRWPQGNPEVGYLNCDGSPTKTWLINHYLDGTLGEYWTLNLGKRPMEELYDLKKDPDCLHNLAEIPAYQLLKLDLQAQMTTALKAEGDLRMFGRGDWWEQQPYSGRRHHFYRRYLNGEQVKFPGWITPSDLHVIDEQ